MRKVALTTTDNPYDPIENFDNWFRWDTVRGYNTAGYLARIAKTSDNLTDYLNEIAIEAAIDEIVAMQIGPACIQANPQKYVKVVKNTTASPSIDTPV